jgi:arsenite oxidase small subunit
MKQCKVMVDAGRRKFLSGAGIAVAGVAASNMVTAPARAAPAAARVDYPVNRLANIRDLKVNEPLSVAHPDADAPGGAAEARHKGAVGRWTR